MSETLLYMNEVCYGIDLRQYDVNQLRKSRRINLKWVLNLYKALTNKEKFFGKTQSTQMGNTDFPEGVYDFKKITSGKTITLKNHSGTFVEKN
jgi:hypothetical protein